VVPGLDEVRSEDDVDLGDIGLLTHFESDAGPYITSGIIYAEHPRQESET
jgi:UbiD family decarboxylase